MDVDNSGVIVGGREGWVGGGGKGTGRITGKNKIK